MARILLIDDCTEITEALVALIGSKHHLTVASTLKAAQSFLEKNKYDLLLLDVDLPDGNGFEFYSRMQEEKNLQTMTFFLTGADDLSHRLLGFELGARDYVTKPFYSSELLARIEMHLKHNLKSA